MQAKLGDGVVVAGCAGKDADYKLVGSKNTPLCKFSVVVGKDANDKNIYANVDAWYRLAYYCAGIKKGDNVLVVGKTKTNTKNGVTYTSIVADYVGNANLDPLMAGMIPASDASTSSTVGDEEDVEY